MKSRLTLRIAAPIIILSLVPLAVGVGFAWKIHREQKNLSDVIAVNVTSMRASEELAINIRDVRTSIERYLQTGDKKHLDAIPALRRETDYWLYEAVRTSETEREIELTERIKKNYTFFFAEYDRICSDPSSAVFSERLRELNNDAFLTKEILEPTQEFLDFNEDQVAEGSAENQRMAGQVVLGLTLLGVCGPVAGLLAGFGIARGVSRSLVRLSVPIRDAAGKLNEVVGRVTFSAGSDLDDLEAELHRMAEQVSSVVARLQQSQREALRAEQLAAVGQMAAGIAHELRNPLMSMKILVQSAAAQGGPARLGSRDLAVLEEEIARLERLTRTFLDFARPPRPSKRPVEAQTLVQETVALLAERAARQNVSIDFNFPPAPVFVEADVGQVRQVLLNLLINALEAIPGGGAVSIRLETKTLPQSLVPTVEWSEAETRPKRWVVLHVTDTGPGLPTELAQDIFTPFISTKETGIGLGLSICKRIVEAHGGEITAANEERGGAVFSVTLPGAANVSAEAAIV